MAIELGDGGVSYPDAGQGGGPTDGMTQAEAEKLFLKKIDADTKFGNKADKTALAQTDAKVTTVEDKVAALEQAGTGGLTEQQADDLYISKTKGGKLTSSYIDLNQDAGIRTVMTDDQGADRGLADVLGATDGMDGRIEVGSDKEGLTLNSKDLPQVYVDSEQKRFHITLDDPAFDPKKHYVRSGGNYWVDLADFIPNLRADFKDAGTVDGTVNPMLDTWGAPTTGYYMITGYVSEAFLGSPQVAGAYEGLIQKQLDYAGAKSELLTYTTFSGEIYQKVRVFDDWSDWHHITAVANVTPPDLTGYLTKVDAANKYLTILNAAKNFEPKASGLEAGFKYAKTTEGWAKLPVPRGAVGVLHVSNNGTPFGNVSPNYAINIVSIENSTYDFNMDWTPNNEDVLILINDGEQQNHILGWALPSGTTIGGFHSYNVNPGEEVWLSYKKSTKEFIIFRKSYDALAGTFTNTAGNDSTIDGSIGKIIAKGAPARYDAASKTLTLDLSNLSGSAPDLSNYVTKAYGTMNYVAKSGNENIRGHKKFTDSVDLAHHATLKAEFTDEHGTPIALSPVVQAEPGPAGNLLLGSFSSSLRLKAKDTITMELEDGTIVNLYPAPAPTSGMTEQQADLRYLQKSEMPAPPTGDGDYVLHKNEHTSAWVKLPAPTSDQPNPSPDLTVTDETTSNGHTQEIDFDPKFFQTRAVPNKPKAIAVTMHEMFLHNTMSPGYTAFFDRTQKIIGDIKNANGYAHSRLFPNDVHVFSGQGAYITADPVSNAFILNSFKDTLGSVNDNAEYFVSFTIDFKGNSKDVNIIYAYLWDEDAHDFVRTTTGEYLAVQTTFSQGQKMYPLQCSGVIDVDVSRTLTLHVQASKPEDIVIQPLDVSGSGIMFQALTKNYKTGLALMEYMLMTRTDMQFQSVMLKQDIGSSHLAVETLTTNPKQCPARTSLSFPTNFRFNSLLESAIYRAGDAIIVRPSDKNMAHPDGSLYIQYDLGFNLGDDQIKYMRGQNMKFNVSVQSPDREHFIRVYTWTKTTQTPTQIAEGLNLSTHDIQPFVGWNEIKAHVCAANLNWIDYEVDFAVPTDSHGIAVVVMSYKEQGKASSRFKNFSLNLARPEVFYDINIASNHYDPMHMSARMVRTEYKIPPEMANHEFYLLTASMEALSLGEVVKNTGVKCEVSRDYNLGGDLNEFTYVETIKFNEDALIQIDTSVRVKAIDETPAGRTINYSFHWAIGREQPGTNVLSQTYVPDAVTGAYVTGGEKVIHYQKMKPVTFRVTAGDIVTLRGVGEGSGDVELVSNLNQPCIINTFTIIE